MPVLTEDYQAEAKFVRDSQAYQVLASTTIFAGAIVALDAAGFAIPATDTAGLVIVGRARDKVDNSAGGNGDEDVIAEKGVFLYNNDSGSPVVQADVGRPALVEDDNSFATSTVNSISAGQIRELEPDTNQVWVAVALAS